MEEDNRLAAAELVQEFVRHSVQSDSRLSESTCQAEALSLGERLSERGTATLEYLARKYKVALLPILEILLRNRMAWRFENDWRPFAEGASLREAESWAGKLDEAAEILERLRGLLVLDWRQSFAQALDVMRESPEAEIDENDFLGRLATTEALRQKGEKGRAPPRLAKVAVSEAMEQYSVVKLVHDGGCELDADGQYVIRLNEQIEAALTVLRKAALTCARRDWSTGVDSSGREPAIAER